MGEAQSSDYGVPSYAARGRSRQGDAERLSGQSRLANDHSSTQRSDSGNGRAAGRVVHAPRDWIR